MNELAPRGLGCAAGTHTAIEAAFTQVKLDRALLSVFRHLLLARPSLSGCPEDMR